MGAEFGVDIAAFAKTLTGNADENMSKVKQFMDTHFGDTRKNLEADAKMLGDEIDVELGVHIQRWTPRNLRNS